MALGAATSQNPAPNPSITIKSEEATEKAHTTSSENNGETIHNLLNNYSNKRRKHDERTASASTTTTTSTTNPEITVSPSESYSFMSVASDTDNEEDNEEDLASNVDSLTTSTTQQPTNGSGNTTRKPARPILETDDPVLSDKRRRNRIAAEKCRMRRKERQSTLETINRGLSLQLESLTKKLTDINEESRKDVHELQMKNRVLKSENQLLRNRLLGRGAVSQQQATGGFFVTAANHFSANSHNVQYSGKRFRTASGHK